MYVIQNKSMKIRSIKKNAVVVDKSKRKHCRRNRIATHCYDRDRVITKKYEKEQDDNIIMNKNFFQLWLKSLLFLCAFS